MRGIAEAMGAADIPADTKWWVEPNMGDDMQVSGIR